MNQFLTAPLGVGLLGAAWLLTPPTAPVGGEIGTSLPQVSFEDFAQTEASTFSDYFGQAVLFEFFAYW